MKKYISTLLVLVMVFTLVLPLDKSYAASREAEIFDTLIGSALWEKIEDLTLGEKLDFALFLITLDEKNIMVNDIMDALEAENGELKERLKNNGIDKDAFAAAAEVLSDFRKDYDITGVIVPILNNTLTINTTVNGKTIETIMGELRENMAVALFDANQNLNAKMVDSNKKVDMALTLVDLLMSPDYMMVKKQGSAYKVEVKINELVSAINTEVIGAYFDSVAPLTSNEQLAIAEIYDTFEARLNGSTFSASELDIIVKGLDAFGLYNKAQEVADSITSIPAPAKDAKSLTLPVVPSGFTVAIKTSSNTNVIALNGTITPPASETVVTLTLEVTRTRDNSKATTAPINVTVPARTSTGVGGGGGGGGGGAAPSGTTVTITAGQSGTVKADGVTITLPANAFGQDVKVTVKVVSNTSSLPMPSVMKLISQVFEITKDQVGKFDKPVTITLNFDKSKVDLEKYDLAIFWLNEETKQWIKLDNIKVDLAAGKVSGDVDHFTKFAVLAVEKQAPVVPLPAKVELTDIKGHWAEANILKLVETGAISGYPDKTFRPNNNITRAEFATVLVKAFKLEQKTGKVFADTANHWAKDYIATAAAYGIVSGYDVNKFGPNDLITREQMAAMVVKAAGLDTALTSKTFTDSASISAWAVDAVNTAVNKEIIKGYPDNSFKPQGKATRAEAVTVIVNALK